MGARLSIEAVIAAYEQTGSVWKAAPILGICGQTVHARLQRHGYKTGNPYTDRDRARIREYYTTEPRETFDLAVLVKDLGRPNTSICKMAREMGLTIPRRQKSEKAKSNIKTTHKDIWKTYPHPRGALGMVHTPETKAVLSVKSKDTWAKHKATGTGLMSPTRLQEASDRMSIQMNGADPSRMYSRGAGGYREDLGPIYFRSRWEANYARYLNWLIKLGEIEGWEYEPDTFWFEAIKRGVRSYKPDFKIREKGKTYYVEIKGYMDAKSATKIKRMRIYHPTVELRLVAQNDYYAIAKSVSALIPNWETEIKGKRVSPPLT